MSTYKVVFWDVYGVLVMAQRGDLNSLVAREPELRAAFEQVVHNFALTIAAENLHHEFLRVIAAERAAMRAAGVAHPEVRIEQIWRQLLEEAVPEARLTLSFAQEVALFFERHANPKRLRPSAFDTLVALKQRGYRQGIISNAQFYTPIELGELLRLESDGRVATAESIFEPRLTVFSYQLGISKPDPALFRHALGSLDPAACVMIGDSAENDLAPARALGLAAIHFGTDIRQLPELLTRL